MKYECATIFMKYELLFLFLTLLVLDKVEKIWGFLIIYTGSRFGSAVRTLEPETEPELPVF